MRRDKDGEVCKDKIFFAVLLGLRFRSIALTCSVRQSFSCESVRLFEECELGLNIGVQLFCAAVIDVNCLLHSAAVCCRRCILSFETVLLRRRGTVTLRNCIWIDGGEGRRVGIQISGLARYYSMSEMPAKFRVGLGAAQHRNRDMQSESAILEFNSTARWQQASVLALAIGPCRDPSIASSSLLPSSSHSSHR